MAERGERGRGVMALGKLVELGIRQDHLRGAAKPVTAA